MWRVVIALLLTCSGPAFADILWAVSGSSGFAGQLWTIDTTTFTATQGPALSLPVEGDISWLNGTLYGGSSTNLSYNGIGTIDPLTGQVTILNASIPVQSLAAISDVSELFDIGSSLGGMDIISPTGSLIQHTTTLSNPGQFVQDLAYDSRQGALYGTDVQGDLDVFDSSTGMGTVVGHLIGSGGRAEGPVAYDWKNDTLYMLYLNTATNSDDLYTVNTQTGAATLLGPTGVNGVRFSGFADLALPEPTSMTLIGIGLAGLWVASRRRRLL